MSVGLMRFPRLSRIAVVYAHDILMAALSFYVSLMLRVGERVFEQMPLPQFLLAVGLFTLVCAVVFRLMGMYRGLWRYASITDMVAIVRAVTLATLVFVLVLFAVSRLEALPRSLPIINWFVLIALLGGPRFLYRLLKDRSLKHVLEDGGPKIPVLLAEIGPAADQFIRLMETSPQADYCVVGLVTQKAKNVGMRLRHAEVLGTYDDIAEVIDRLKRAGTPPQRLIVTRDDLDPQKMRQLLDAAERLGMTMARLPPPNSLREGMEDRIQLRPVAIEDLLGRPQSSLDRDAMRQLVQGRRVLITGAGGSIGSELARQVADLAPLALTLVESSEFALYTIDMELQERRRERESFPSVFPRIADVRDAGRIAAVFAEAQPQLVIHAAALKHVPMVEENPLEGLRTNTLGTRVVGEACRRWGTELMVVISTDKAVNPTNVMGSSKRMAELYCQAADLLAARQGGTRFVTVRFGNVLGSTGSVVPLFQRQLAQGGPLTVTHPEMTRYFMTIREAVELVLQASASGDRDLAGRIFVLDMGEPVKIVDLAHQMIRLAGLRPGADVKVVFTGLRPGEKLFEEIFHGSEPPVPTPLPGILVATPRMVEFDALQQSLDQLAEACAEADVATALAVLRQLVPEYSGVHCQEGCSPASGRE